MSKLFNLFVEEEIQRDFLEEANQNDRVCERRVEKTELTVGRKTMQSVKI